MFLSRVLYLELLNTFKLKYCLMTNLSLPTPIWFCKLYSNLCGKAEGNSLTLRFKEETQIPVACFSNFGVQRQLDFSGTSFMVDWMIFNFLRLIMQELKLLILMPDIHDTQGHPEFHRSEKSVTMQLLSSTTKYKEIL